MRRVGTTHVILGFSGLKLFFIMNSTLIQIRRATSEDIGAIVSLWEEYMDFHADRDRHFSRSEDGHRRFGDYISGRIVDDASYVTVAEQQQKIVGFCLATLGKFPPVFAAREYGSITDLAVTAAARRQGIGQALVEAALQWFAERNVSRVEVRAATSNEVSLTFWRKMGFTPYLAILQRNAECVKRET